jgi:hypothetical protein
VSWGRAIWGFLAALVTFGCSCALDAPPAAASLSVPTGGPPVTFGGSGASGTATALSAFESAAGGGDNGTTAGEQRGGFRHLTWDGVAVDGSDPGSTVIVPGQVAALARSRLEPWGIELGPDVAVANDRFVSVNPNATGLFSAPTVWAPFNSDTAELQVVTPASTASTPTPAQTRGLGVVFLNVRLADTTEIQYYNGDILLGQAFAPVGAMSFAGLLFPDPVVTRVVVTLGTATLFGFDGTSVSPGGQDSGLSNLVAGDDVVLAEPAPARPAVAASAGVPVTQVLDTFSDTDPSATAADFTAAIDWGDGSRTSGTITPGPAAIFTVTGGHRYAQAGTYTAVVTVADFSGSGPEQSSSTTVQVASRPTAISINCSPSPVAVSAAATCTATVIDRGPGSAILPSGTVAFSSPTPGATFLQDAGCVLGPSAITGQATCQVALTPDRLPPRQARVDAHYVGDAAHAASDASATLPVRAQRCTLHVLTKRLSGISHGLAVIVSCDARSNVSIAVQAVVAPTRLERGLRFTFGKLRASAVAGRPTVLVIKPAAGSTTALRAAAGRHQRVRLRLTLTASSPVTQAKTTTRIGAAIQMR